MKVYKALGNVHEDTQILQDDLNALEQWSIDWQLSFNTTKCEVMRISQKNDASSPGYHLCGNRLNTVSEMKDLGIYIICHGVYKPPNVQTKLTVFLALLDGLLGQKTRICSLNCTKVL